MTFEQTGISELVPLSCETFQQLAVRQQFVAPGYSQIADVPHDRDYLFAAHGFGSPGRSLEPPSIRGLTEAEEHEILEKSEILTDLRSRIRRSEILVARLLQN